jgi:predicted TIM-barrel fold metal-dependent hydrolase
MTRALDGHRTRARHPDVERIKAHLDHPVIDADGHTVEITPIVFDFVKQVGGTSGLERFQRHMRTLGTLGADDPLRWTRQPRHWVFPADTLDRATASLPRLYHDRMDEIGLDVSLVYPTMAIVFSMIDDEDMRLLACRAVNHYLAELHQGLTDRILPVGVIPMHTPEEAVAELDHVVHTLGMRAVMIPSFVKRPLGRNIDDGYRVDAFGIDSEYDYDPFWARCVELGVVPGVHTPTWGMPMRESVTNYAFTHIGQFSSGAEVFCRAAVMGGVFHRFPGLSVAALEGGVGWAASLYTGMLGHWEKRNGRAIHQYDPERLDRDEMAALLDTYGPSTPSTDAVLGDLLRPATYTPANLDDFGACPFETAEELRDLFTSHIYVGCEADDPMNALAFDTEKNALGARFRVLLGSDISHWDVTDISTVLAEAYELVDDGLITPADFEELTFSNAVRLYAGANPDFFAGTPIEDAVGDWLAAR